MITILYLTAVVVLAGLGALVIAMRAAPDGYQNEDGFHLQTRRAAVPVDLLASTPRRARDDVGHVAGTIAQA